tara:strand:+ start:1059 stop:1478 length:420 start_codon:yes stop_codon:yes gene_type:complete
MYLNNNLKLNKMISKKLKKKVKDTTGLRFSKKNTRIQADLTFECSPVYIGNVCIYDKEGLEELIVMLKTSRDYLYQPITDRGNYKVIPTHTNYMISRKGVVVHRDSLYPLKTSRNQCNLIDNNGKACNHAINSLIKKTF